MTDLSAAIAAEHERAAQATARANQLEQHLARITRHTARDPDSGQFRERTPAEAHADAVRAALNGRNAKKALTVAALTGGRNHDPLHGFTPVTEYQPQRPLPPAFTFTRLND
ncbi:MAG TPA: hypothetical protein VHV75_12240 [Solirubrobacteraceae bacterium]|jgi:hypothetical protein|nr:hypothetical protein [Solirubrobacteraceae bacterium]